MRPSLAPAAAITLLLVIYIALVLTNENPAFLLSRDVLLILAGLFAFAATAMGALALIRIRSNIVSDPKTGQTQRAIVILAVGLMSGCVAEIASIVTAAVQIRPYILESAVSTVTNVMFMALSLLVVVAVWRIYWHIGTSPVEEIGSMTTLMVALWAVAVLASSKNLASTENLSQQAIGILITASYPIIDIFSFMLVTALVFGRSLRRFTSSWRVALALLLIGQGWGVAGDIIYGLIRARGSGAEELLSLGARLALLFFAVGLVFLASGALQMLKGEMLPG